MASQFVLDGIKERLIARHVFKGLVVTAKLFKRRHRVRLIRKSALPLIRREPDELLRIAEWKRPQQNLVHHAENRDIGSNPESQDADRNNRERLIAFERAECIAQVLSQQIQPRQSARVTLLLLGLRYSSETSEG